MSFLATLNESRTLIRIGLVFLILANLAKWLLPRTGWVPTDLLDAVTGLLFGISIAALLLGLSRKRSTPHATPRG